MTVPRQTLNSPLKKGRIPADVKGVPWRERQIEPTICVISAHAEGRYKGLEAPLFDRVSDPARRA